MRGSAQSEQITAIPTETTHVAHRVTRRRRYLHRFLLFDLKYSLSCFSDYIDYIDELNQFERRQTDIRARLRFEADLGLLPNEAFVHADGRPVEFVEVDEESARGVLGELLDEDEAPAQAVGVG